MNKFSKKLSLYITIFYAITSISLSNNSIVFSLGNVSISDSSVTIKNMDTNSSFERQFSGSDASAEVVPQTSAEPTPAPVLAEIPQVSNPKSDSSQIELATIDDVTSPSKSSFESSFSSIFSIIEMVFDKILAFFSDSEDGPINGFDEVTPTAFVENTPDVSPAVIFSTQPTVEITIEPTMDISSTTPEPTDTLENTMSTNDGDDVSVVSTSTVKIDVRSMLIKTWRHSYEEITTDGTIIYRPDNFKKFPASRFRMGYTFEKDSICKHFVLEPADRHYWGNGTWSYDDNTKKLVINKTDNNGKQQIDSYTVVEISTDILKLR